MQITAIYRLSPNNYALENNLGRKFNITIHDDDLLYLAKALGFDEWYDLEDHLEVLTETWVGCILIQGGAKDLPADC